MPLREAPKLADLYQINICNSLQCSLSMTLRFTSSVRCWLSMLIVCGAMQAQNGQIAEQDLVPDQIATVAAPATDLPLTLGQNYAWSVHQIFAPGQLFLIAGRAAIDHSRNDPSGWGEGPDGYALRVASRLGRVAVRQNLAFAVRALDHEDPRYFRSRETGIWRRSRYAVGRTFVVRNERGGTMPAYSLLLGDFATPFIAQVWRPQPVNAGREFRGGAIGIGIDAISNVGREFWPDIRKKLHP